VLSITNKHFMLSVIMLNVVMLNAVAPLVDSLPHEPMISSVFKFLTREGVGFLSIFGSIHNLAILDQNNTDFVLLLCNHHE
jgi:hypothetical protein